MTSTAQGLTLELNLRHRHLTWFGSKCLITAFVRDKQHLVNLLELGGLYAAVDEVREALAPMPDRQRAILDLGT